MPPPIAAALCGVLIIALFYLDLARADRVSARVWLPVLWFAIVGSRSVTDWLKLSPPQYSTSGSEGSPLDRAVITVLLVAGVAVLFVRANKLQHIIKNNAPILIFFAYSALSVLWADQPDVAGKRWMRGFVDLVMIFVLLTESDPSTAINVVLKRVGFVLLPTSILLIRYFPEYGRVYISWSGAAMWTGVTTHKSALGQTSMIYGLASVFLFLKTLSAMGLRQGWRGLLAHGTITCIAVYLLQLCDSKTSQVCFVIGTVVLCVTILTRVRRHAMALTILALMLIGAPFSVLFLDVSSSAIETLGRDSSLTGRTEIWKTMLMLVDNPWLGAGYEGFLTGGRVSRIVGELGLFYTPHNGYLETYLNLGVIGVFGLAFVILVAFRSTLHRVTKEREGAALLFAFLICALVYNFTEGAFKMMTSMWLMFLMAAVRNPEYGGRTVGHLWLDQAGGEVGRDNIKLWPKEVARAK